jgi:hypothetical protein
MSFTSEVDISVEEYEIVPAVEEVDIGGKLDRVNQIEYLNYLYSRHWQMPIVSRLVRTH